MKKLATDERSASSRQHCLQLESIPARSGIPTTLVRTYGKEYTTIPALLPMQNHPTTTI